MKRTDALTNTIIIHTNGSSVKTNAHFLSKSGPLVCMDFKASFFICVHFRILQTNVKNMMMGRTEKENGRSNNTNSYNFKGQTEKENLRK